MKVLRRLRQSPGVAAAAIVSIGLGIAANSTIFSIVSRLVLRPPPVGDPGSLFTLRTANGSECCNSFSYPLYENFRAQTRSFSEVTAYYELLPASIGGRGEPERVWGQAVTSNFFSAAQLGMPLGRGFAAAEEHEPLIVLGYGLWQRRFAGDAAIEGKHVLLSGQPFTVVGVTPRGFHGLDPILDAQFWVPLGNMDRLMPNTANYQSRDYHWLAVDARLSHGASREQAAAELAVLESRLAKSFADGEKGSFRMDRAGALPPRDRATIIAFLTALSVIVLLVLGIACANVANLLLAQAAERQREMAVRLALGASRGNLMRQMMAESMILAAAGGLLGVALSLWATQALSAFRLPAPVPLDLKVAVDWRVLLYTGALSMGSGLLFGMAPAWAAAKPVLANALKAGDLAGRPGSRWTLRNALVVSQIAMSMVLLCATGLFLRSLRSAAGIETGFHAHGVLTLSVDPRVHGYTPERTAQFLNEVRHRVAGLPGVISAACTDIVPLSGGGRRDGMHVEGTPGTPQDPGVDLYMVSPGYFETMGIPLVAGHTFSEGAANGPRTAVVDQRFAEKFFGKETAVGKRVVGAGTTFEIIGVVKNIKSRTIGEELRPVLFRGLEQSIAGDPSFLGYAVLAKTAGSPGELAAAVRREIHALDPDLAVYNEETLEQHLRDALFLPRLAGTLFGVFGLTGLVLAAVGLYGVMSYAVSRRRREIGIRVALGAPLSAIRSLVVGQGLRLTAVAVGIGVAAAWAMARFAASLLYGVDPHDRSVFIGVPLFLAAVALAACWIPARRAARVDPMTALRHE